MGWSICKDGGYASILIVDKACYIHFLMIITYFPPSPGLRELSILHHPCPA